MKHAIPEGALQQHVAVLGKTGSGKTFAVKGIVEHWLEQHRRVGIVDPTGAWWGLRSSKDGKGPGFPILVLGGDHGDLPLPALGGAAVARLLAEQGVNLVADTSLLGVGERTRWFIDFATTLYRANRAPLHLVLDEAHNFAPQGGGAMRDPDVGKMLHAANTLASGGRSRGIRLAMITQRPQKLHKDALTSADTLIAMRVLAPQDRGAVEEWVKGCGDIAQGKEVLNSLASLKRGEGWAWWPEGGFLERLTFPAIKTFDSSATPTHGSAIAAPKSAAAIDLTEIRAALADAVREAEENDPKLLKAEIAKLRKAASSAKPAAAVDPKALEDEYSRGYQHGREAGRGEITSGLLHMLDRIGNLAGGITDAITGARTEIHALHARAAAAPSTVTPRAEYRVERAPGIPRKNPDKSGVKAGNAALGNSGKRRILVALAQNPDGLMFTKLSILTGISRKGGTWRIYLKDLRDAGWVEGEEPVRATAAGLAELGDYEPLPTGAELLGYWRKRLGNSGKRAILDAVVAAWPRAIAAAKVSEQSGISMAGGTWRIYLKELRDLELIHGRDELTASEDLFR